MPEIAFMVMPYGRKSTMRREDGVPREVDFNVLWHEVHRPVLEDLGYRAVRADSDLGPLVIVEMIRRLALADLVVADVSLANSNVYYEVGVRHAARRHCILVAAEWAEPVFDLEQIRRLEYPLSDGACGAEAAAEARAVLRAGIERVLPGRSPVFDAIPGYPDPEDGFRQAAFSDLVGELSGFEAGAGAIRLTADAEDRRSRTRDLVTRYGTRPVVRESVVLELIELIRDNLTWAEVLAYVEGLPPVLRRHPSVVEQRQLALARTGRVEESAAALEQLIKHSGPTSERYGLLGGRYKELMWSNAGSPRSSGFLGKTIAAYEQGMRLDLNDYYPSSNLPRLYRLRDAEGDGRLADEVAVVARAAREISLARDPHDEWIRLTLLGSAFDDGDLDRARGLVGRFRQEGVTGWKLRSTLEDLELGVRLLPRRPGTPQGAAEGLRELLAELYGMLG
ncbi:tetratricopeptide repeat-containing protein [Planomonospora sp. ID82291]|uniref:tetratricopeptide repeat-containing protein n=1 Tax=Planomonospora sp. ID82291 TaxID=2738136 RepID=UPI0018C36B00|nr:tetratricopeptide repeat-containing protein [Planomonospora sp. ID82291]MBG0817569.1 hypothetical protein [Planomonospora sp. ID82291]